MIRGYGKVYAIGHRAVAELFDGPVEIQEKIDGSQFSFGKALDGTLLAKSRTKMLDFDAPEKMFAAGLETVREVEPLLVPGWTYRGEYLQKPKHNALCYDRTPAKHVIIYDIDRGQEDLLDRHGRRWQCQQLGLESIPVLGEGTICNVEELLAYLDTVSVLGGCKVEGIVVKNYAHFSPQGGHGLKGKFVSESFREIQGSDWKRRNPTGKDIRGQIGDALCTEARWLKAIQHLEERGELQGGPEDIGPLMREINMDTLEECQDDIKEALFKWAWKDIARMVAHGFPMWYKERLAAGAFDAAPTARLWVDRRPTPPEPPE